ncbi:MAG: archaeosortase/exosortase family protein [Phycisphaerales bacterium]|nr:archaeosortase/exosortase family protein [Phycisphaerales bacterium]
MARRKSKDDDAGSRASGGDSGPTAGGRRPVLRAVLAFVAIMGAYYILEYAFLITSTGETKLLASYLSFIASSTADLLGLIGQEGVAYGARVGARIGSKTFNVEIVHGCDAMEPMAAFAAAVLASPVALRAKSIGLVIGLPVLFAVNYVRLVTLFLIGIYMSKGVFDVAHHEVWQAAFIAIAIVFWAVWVQWATRKKPEPEPVHDSG